LVVSSWLCILKLTYVLVVGWQLFIIVTYFSPTHTHTHTHTNQQQQQQQHRVPPDFFLKFLNFLNLEEDREREGEREMKCVSAIEMWKGSSSSSSVERRISLGSEHLDAVLNGGVRTRGITEITGRAGSGKTQICLQLCAQVGVLCFITHTQCVYFGMFIRFYILKTTSGTTP
jgi:hypothetical protein